MSHRFLPLAVGVLLLAAAPIRADDAEDQAVKAVEKLGGKVVREDKDPAKPVVEVNLAEKKATDAALKELAGLKALRTLDLRGCGGVTDAGLKELADLKELRTLHLDETQITDEALRVLREIGLLQALDRAQTADHMVPFNLDRKRPTRPEDVRTLSLSGCTKVTDAGLKELSALKALQNLDLIGTAVTDAGLKDLADFKGLQTLNLMACGGVTDAGLKELAALKELKELNLSSCQGVTDAGLKELAGLQSLQTLYLSFTPVTDAGLKELADLKGLQTLYLRATKATDAGVAELQKALPNCKIKTKRSL